MPNTSSPSTSEMTDAAPSTRPTISARLFAPQCSGEPSRSSRPAPANSTFVQPLPSRPSHLVPFTVPLIGCAVNEWPPKTRPVRPYASSARPMSPTGPLASETPSDRFERAMSAPRARVVDVDLLLAELLVDGPLLDLDVLVQPHALLRDRALVGDDLLLVQHDLVLLLGDVGAARRGVDVGIRDRLALDPDLFALDGDGLLDVLGHHVLAQARAAALTLGRAHPELLLGARHRIVGGRTRNIAAHGARRIAAVGDLIALEALTAGAALGQPGVR